MPVAPMVAIEPSLLLHEPPVVSFDNVVVAPAHTFIVPVMDAIVGNGLTVTIAVAIVVQPKPFITL